MGKEKKIKAEYQADGQKEKKNWAGIQGPDGQKNKKKEAGIHCRWWRLRREGGIGAMG